MSKSLLFVGSAKYFPNKDAIAWLVNELMPKIKKIDPTIKLHIVGSYKIDFTNNEICENVIFEGFVSNKELELSHLNADLFICPVVLGAGIKVKLLEASSYGIPILATKESLSGIDFLNNAAIPFNRNDTNLAKYICELLSNRTLLQDLSTKAVNQLQLALSTRGDLLDCINRKTNDTI